MAADERARFDIASLWRQTAGAEPRFARLAADRRCDVVVIGGGYTGLSTARSLARQGLEPVVLEANRIGWGASGRNGGVVSGKFRQTFSRIAERHGIAVARSMHDLGLQAVAHVGELVADYGIADAGYEPTGSLRCAHNEATFRGIRSEAEWLRGALGDTACSILSREEVAGETGSRDFVGGVLNTHGGIIHPLAFAFGLARGIAAEGVAVFEESPVLRLRREGSGVLVETPGGNVEAAQVVIATNSYSDLTPATAAVRRSIIPFRSAMIATAPLAGTPAEGLLRTNRSYTETRRMMRWFRKAGGRLIYGGRGAFGRTDSEGAFAALQRAMVRQFPELGEVAVTHRWSGLVAMTLDGLPHLGRLDDRVVYSVGYNGTGVALSSYIGRHVAALVSGAEPDLGLITSERLKPVPFYPVREPAVRLVAGWYQFLDAIGR